MSTVVYGAGDDCIEIAGDVKGEVSYSEDEKGILLFCSDGTVLQVKYGKDIENAEAVWEVKVKARGTLIDKVIICDEETDDNYSDRVYFMDGLKWVYAASEWERVS